MTERKLLCIGDLSPQAFWRIPPALPEALQQQAGAQVDIRIATNSREFMPLARQAHYIIGFPFPANLVRGNPYLQWVHFLTSHVPSSWENSRADIKVTDCRGVNADSVADHGLYLIYRALRGEPCHRVGTPANPADFAVAQNPQQLSLGIMGLGEIGSRLLQRCRGRFRQVNVLTRTGHSVAGANTFTSADLPAFLRQSDYLVLALPLTPHTRALFDAAFYANLPPGATLINLARGELLDEAELLQHLQADSGFRYLTDVTHPEPYPLDGPLLRAERVFITPHIGGRQQGIWDALAQRTLQIAQDTIQ